MIANLTLSHNLSRIICCFRSNFFPIFATKQYSIPMHSQTAAVKRVMQIHESADSFGDILLFLPGKDEVDQACGELVK